MLDPPNPATALNSDILPRLPTRPTLSDLYPLEITGKPLRFPPQAPRGFLAIPGWRNTTLIFNPYIKSRVGVCFVLLTV